MAMVLAPIFITQTTIIQKVSTLSRNIDRMFQTKLYFVESSIATIKDKQSTLEKKITHPTTQLKFEIKKPSDASAAKNFKNIYSQIVTATWLDNRIKRSEILLSFVYKPEPKQKEKAAWADRDLLYSNF